MSDAGVFLAAIIIPILLGVGLAWWLGLFDDDDNGWPDDDLGGT